MENFKLKSSYSIAIVGATGAVGDTFLRLLEERKFPVADMRMLASSRSAGRKLMFNSKEYTVEELNDNSFNGIDIAFFSAGGETSLAYAHKAVAAGALVIDNSSAFRMDNDVPLVVPEVNPEDAFKHKGIIANPNCTTIIMVVPLKVLNNYSQIEKVIVSSYQSTSGAGASGMQELIDQTKAWVNGTSIEKSVFPHQILFNIIPQIDSPAGNGYTKEEMKMYHETRKILHSDIKVSATCVRVPVLSAHSESVTVITEKKIGLAKALELFGSAKGVKVLDELDKKVYPMPLDAAGQDLCYVGRVREDLAYENGITFFVTGDQLRKGAATNAIQIAELIISN